MAPYGSHARRQRSRAPLVAIIAVAVVALGVLAWMVVPLASPQQPSRAAAAVIPAPVVTPTPSVTPTPTVTPKPTPAEPKSYEVANLSRSVDRYDQPGGKVVGTVKGDWAGWQSKLPIIDKKPGWLRVRLQFRPNEDTAWIKANGVKITTTPYRILVDTKKHKLTLFKDGTEVFTAPVGVGKKATPTPKGHFFVAFLQPPLSSGYAPIMLFLSAHSTAIKSWQGSGDAITAIHGPVGSDARIGTDGAAISNGCIRMHKDDLAKLTKVLPGSPVDIV